MDSEIMIKNEFFSPQTLKRYMYKFESVPVHIINNNARYNVFYIKHIKNE